MSRVVFGIHPVKEALKSDSVTVDRLMMRKGGRSHAFDELVEMAKESGVRIRMVDAVELNRLCDGGNHQNVAAIVSDFAYTDLDEWLIKLGDGPGKDVLVLDQIQDPHNLGALIRTAESLGYGAVLIPQDRSAAVDAVAMKASAGAAAYLPICRVTNIARSLDALKEHGYWVLGTEVDAKLSLYSADLTGALVVVLGNEGQGMRPLVSKTCDYLVRLPREGQIQSLNVSVAGAIVMAEIWRQKHSNG
jgi:23S rRNA (guanosine2251-2'-O)-methyltransferase